MASDPITSWQIDRETVETLVYFIIIIIIFGGGRLEITEMVIPAMKLKEAYC